MEGNLNPFLKDSFPDKKKQEKLEIKREMFENVKKPKKSHDERSSDSQEKEGSKKKILLKPPIKKVRKATPNSKNLKKHAMSSLFQDSGHQRSKDEFFLRLLPKSDNTLRAMMFFENFPRLELKVSSKISLKKVLEHLNSKWFSKYPGKFLIDLYPDSTKWLQNTQLETLNSSRKFESTILSENYLINDIIVGYNSHQDKALYVYYEIREKSPSLGVSATSASNNLKTSMASPGIPSGTQKPLAHSKSSLVLKPETDEKSRKLHKIPQLASINSTSNPLLTNEKASKIKYNVLTTKVKPSTPGGLSINSNMPEDGILSLSMKSDAFGRLLNNNNTQGYSNQHFSNQAHHNQLNSIYSNINESFSKVVGFDHAYEEADYYDSLRKGILKGSPIKINPSPSITPGSTNGNNNNNNPKMDNIEIIEKGETSKKAKNENGPLVLKDNKTEMEMELKPAVDDAGTHSKSDGHKGSSHEKSNSSFTFNNENSQQQPRQANDSRSGGGGFFASNFRILNERSNKSHTPAEFLQSFTSSNEPPNLLNLISPSLKNGEFMKNNQFQKIVGIIDKVGQDFESNASQNSLKHQNSKTFNSNTNQPKPISIHRKLTK